MKYRKKRNTEKSGFFSGNNLKGNLIMTKKLLAVLLVSCGFVMNSALLSGAEQYSYKALYNKALGLFPAKVNECKLPDAQTITVQDGKVNFSGGGDFTVSSPKGSSIISWKFPPLKHYPKGILQLSAKTLDNAAEITVYAVYDAKKNKCAAFKLHSGKREKITRNIQTGKLKEIVIDVKSKSADTVDISFKDFKISCNWWESCFRKEVTIPEGKIWDAVADVGNMTTLFINGKEVTTGGVIRPDAFYWCGDMYRSKRISFKPYLKPGRNFIELYTIRSNVPSFAYMQGAVIMDSGQRIPINSDWSWEWSDSFPGTENAVWKKIASWKNINQYRKTGSSAGAFPITDYYVKNYLHRGDMPAYCGLIKLVNPCENKLFYTENKEFALKILIPPGFENKKPVVEWKISRFENDKLNIIKKGIAGKFSKNGNSLEFNIKSTALPKGVYTFQSALKTGSNIIEERIPEPFAVTGKVIQKEVAGDFLEQGMDIELEKIVDFTNPNDPHPWMETDAKAIYPHVHEKKWDDKYVSTLKKASIVEKNGLKYRKTAKKFEAQFTYLVDFKHPGDWYLLVLEYPDNAERWIGVGCNPSSRMGKKGYHDGSSKCGPCIWTGGKYPNTGKMLKMKWLYIPDPEPHGFNIMSLMTDSDAAAARLLIYHIKGALPSLTQPDILLSGQRKYGLLSERTTSLHPTSGSSSTGFYNYCSSYSKDFSKYAKVDKSAVMEACARIDDLLDSAYHYAQYLRFSGQNMHVMGCYQYDDMNTCPHWNTGSSRLHYNCRDIAARVFQSNDIEFYASVEYTNKFRRMAKRQTKVHGFYKEEEKDIFFVNKQGEIPPSTMGFMRGCLNFMKPEIRKDMLELAAELAGEFKDLPNFRGINWTAYFGGEWQPSFRGPGSDPLDLGYGDFTTGLFEKETGIKIPVPKDAPDRFMKRYKFLTSPAMKERWMAWRSGKIFEFFEQLYNTVISVNPKLDCIAGAYLNVQHITEWKKSGRTFSKYLKENSWMPKTFKKHKGIWLMPWLHANARYGYYVGRKLPDIAMGWQGNMDDEFYEPFADIEKRALMLCLCWHEVERVAAHFPYRKNWSRPYQQTMEGQQREEMAMEPYTQGMIGMDPQMLFFGFTDVSLYIGVEEMHRKFSRVFRRLPMQKFERILKTGFSTNICIRALSHNGKYYFYAANPGYWPISGTMNLSEKATVHDLVKNRKVSDNGSLNFSLPPFGIAAWKADSGSVKITGWKNNPVPEKELAHMRSILLRSHKILKLSGIEKYLGKKDFSFFKTSTDKAEKAVNEGKYAKAWLLLTNAFYWDILNEKGKDAKYAGNVGPRTIPATEAEKAPLIDGKLNDEIWEKCIGQNRFIAHDKQKAKFDTWAYAAWKNNKLYLAFKCNDANTEKLRNTSKIEKDLFRNKDDVIDFVIYPPGKKYYQFAFNPKGVKFDQQCLSVSSRDYDYHPEWKVKSHIGKKGWTAEVEIDTQKAFGQPILKGREWKINFHRLFRMNEQLPSSWVWSPNIHSMEHMGIIRFTGVNLLSNPSVENIKGNWPVNWGKGGGIGKGCFTWEVSEKEKHSGKYSASIKFNGFKVNRDRLGAYIIVGGDRRTPLLPVTPETDYKFTFWMKSNIPSMRVMYCLKNADGKIIHKPTKPLIHPKPGWNRYTGKFRTKKSTKSAALNFSLYGVKNPAKGPWKGLPQISDETVMYIDDVMIIKEGK